MIPEEVSESEMISSHFVSQSKNLNLFALMAIVEIIKSFSSLFHPGSSWFHHRNPRTSFFHTRCVVHRFTVMTFHLCQTLDPLTDAHV